MYIGDDAYRAFRAVDGETLTFAREDDDDTNDLQIFAV